jgi:hypothetical protein
MRLDSFVSVLALLFALAARKEVSGPFQGICYAPKINSLSDDNERSSLLILGHHSYSCQQVVASAARNAHIPFDMSRSKLHVSRSGSTHAGWGNKGENILKAILKYSVLAESLTADWEYTGTSEQSNNRNQVQNMVFRSCLLAPPSALCWSPKFSKFCGPRSPKFWRPGKTICPTIISLAPV